MRRWRLPVLAATVVLAGCSAPAAPTADVAVRVRTCVDDGARCFALPLPDADVQLLDLGGAVLSRGMTDEAGHCKMALPPDQEVRVVVTSLLLKDGRAVGSLGPTSEGTVSITLDHAMAVNANP